MSALYCITGVTGSGKGHAAKQFEGQAAVIRADIVQHWCGVRLCPSVKPSDVWDWDFWNALIKHVDIQPAMNATVADLHGADLKTDRPVVAEAQILALSHWRDAFVVALQQSGFSPKRTRIAELNAPSEKILAQIQKRGRASQAHYTIKNVRDLKKWYHSVVPNHADVSHRDYDKLIDDIRSFVASG